MEQSTWCAPLCCILVLCCFGGVTHSQGGQRGALSQEGFLISSPLHVTDSITFSTSASAENMDRNSSSSFIWNPNLKIQTTGLWSQTASCQVLPMDFLSFNVQLQQKEQSNSSVPASLGTAGEGWWLSSFREPRAASGCGLTWMRERLSIKKSLPVVSGGCECGQ